MTAASHSVPRLTIGEVLGQLRDEFPDVSISKIRYLEAENLVHPQRTPSGYRKFSRADVDRLRWVLAAQRDQYLPLRVIKEQLEARDRGELPTVPAAEPALAARVPEHAVDPEGTLTAEEFARAAGLDEAQLADCVHYGLLGVDAEGRYAAADLAIARATSGLSRYGIGPRHLRIYRTGAEREAGLVEQLVAPLVRARSEESRARAVEQLAELTALSGQLHMALLEAQLRSLLRP